MNGCAPGLALIERLKATRKWAIEAVSGDMLSAMLLFHRICINNGLPSFICKGQVFPFSMRKRYIHITRTTEREASCTENHFLATF